MDNNDYLLGQLSANVDTLLADVKIIKDNVETLKLWRIQIITASSICSIVVSSLFWAANQYLR